MAILVTIRRLASNWDAKKNAWKVARKIEAYKAAKAAAARKGGSNRSR